MKKERITLRYFIPILAIMGIQAVRYFPFKFGGWNQIQLSLNYSYGFVQRAFLGTVLDLISHIFHIPWGYMRYVYGIVTMLSFTLLLLGLLYKALQMNYTDEIKRSFFFGMALLFFIGPGWNSHYNNFGLTDLWLPILSIVGVYAILKDRGLWIAFVVSAVCILIHPAYVFLYFNMILAAFAYKIFIQDKKIIKKHVVWAVLTFVFSSILFLYMMFFSHAKDGVSIDYVMKRTAEFVSKSLDEIAHHETTISGYLFRKGPTTGVQLVINSYWLLFVVMLVLFSPFIYEVYRYWKTIVLQAKKQKSGIAICIYVLLPLGIITTVPMYIMHNDYGRWTYAAFFYEFAMIWILNLINDEYANFATKELMKRIAANKSYYIVLLFYASVSGAFEQNLINPFISTIESYGWKILDLFGI